MKKVAERLSIPICEGQGAFFFFSYVPENNKKENIYMFVQLLSPKRTSKRGILDLKWCPFAAS